MERLTSKEMNLWIDTYNHFLCSLSPGSVSLAIISLAIMEADRAVNEFKKRTAQEKPSEIPKQ